LDDDRVWRALHILVIVQLPHRPSRSAIIVALVLFVALWRGAVASDFVVIVNKSNASVIDKTTVAKIYTGNMKSWSDGTRVVPLDLPEENAARISFSIDVVGKAVGHLRAYWAQLVFSGNAMPPKVVHSDDEVKKQVSSNIGGIGYIKPSSVDDSVKVAIR
jgi:ABC-type phosphate transport system substrate-binding protein